MGQSHTTHLSFKSSSQNNFLQITEPARGSSVTLGTAGIMPLPLEAVVQDLLHLEGQALGVL